MTTHDVGVSPLRVLSCFTGGGGLDRGLGLAEPTARTVCFVEIEAFAIALLEHQMQNKALPEAPIWSDIRTFDGAAWHRAVDIVVGGFPCTDISSAGKQAGINGEHSGLWFDMARVICDVGPRYVFLENVDALVGLGLDTVLGTLADLRYDAVWGVFSAAEVGAPHQRKRWFCLAVADTAGGGQRERGQSSKRAGQPDRNGEAMADTENRGASPTQFARRLRSSECRGETMVDTVCSGLEGHESCRSGLAARLSAIGAAGNAMADTDETGCCEQRLNIVSKHRNAPSRNNPDRCERTTAGMGQFPPGPNDQRGWERVIDAAPWLAPALTESDLRRVANGLALADRMDLLRLLGNGVVPATAAHAYRVLRDRLMQEGLRI